MTRPRGGNAVLDDEQLSDPLARTSPGLPERRAVVRAPSLPMHIDFILFPALDILARTSPGASGIDGTTSAAIGAALPDDGPAFALIGDSMSWTTRQRWPSAAASRTPTCA